MDTVIIVKKHVNAYMCQIFRGDDEYISTGFGLTESTAIQDAVNVARSLERWYW
jgi:hypothetical protein